MGPLNNEPVAAKMDEHVADALERGASVVGGGARAGGFPTDLYWEPTVLAGVPADARVAVEETFGPIAPVVAIDSLEQAITLTNASPYGLLAAIFTADLSRGLEFADRVRTGWVNINESSNYWEAHLPFGGRAGTDSGIGRVGGAHVMHSFTELQTVVLTPHRRRSMTPGDEVAPTRSPIRRAAARPCSSARRARSPSWPTSCGGRPTESAPLLAALERHELVAWDAGATGLRPGPAALRFARSGVGREDLVELAQPSMRRLADESGETANLILPRPAGTEAIAQVDGEHLLGATNWVGRELGLHCTAAGKVFLAFGAGGAARGRARRADPGDDHRPRAARARARDGPRAGLRDDRRRARAGPVGRRGPGPRPRRRGDRRADRGRSVAAAGAGAAAAARARLRSSRRARLDPAGRRRAADRQNRR